MYSFARWCAAIAAFCTFALAVPAVADNSVAVFSGGQVDFSNNVFFGATVALPGSTVGSGFALRGLGNAGGYDYSGGGLGRVKASFGGGELDGIYQVTRSSFWGDFGAGLNDTFTSLTPYDPGNRLSGQQAELRLTTDGGTVAGPWRADWYGYYGTRLADYQAMLGVTHRVSLRWRLGAQLYGEGNPAYELHQFGPYAGFGLARTSELQFSAGEAWQSGFTPRPYVRALIYQRL